MEDVKAVYCVSQDENTGEWVIDNCTINDAENSITVNRTISGNSESAFIKYMSYNNVEDAQAFLEECAMDSRYDLTYLTSEQINNYLYNYIINNNSVGFVYVPPLDVWTHSMYCATKEFEFGSLSYVASEVAFARDKLQIGVYFPFKTNIGQDHAHSFEEVLRVCALRPEFEPLEVETYYSKSQLELIEYVKQERLRSEQACKE